MQNSYRKVHIDQHLSPLVGEFRFDKRDFQNKLIEGNVGEVTLFAKCHHGHTYYPTKVGVMHPKLHFDLLQAQIDAAHEIGVKANVYIPVGWSELDAEMHPEWRAYNFKTKKPLCAWFDYDETYAKAKSSDPMPNGIWQNLCPSGGYLEYLKRLTREVCERYQPVDGIFFDICFMQTACGCPTCLQGMREQGLDAENYQDAQKYFSSVRVRMMRELNEIIRQYSPKASIFYNGVAERIFDGVDYSQYYPYVTHFEIEELSSNEGNFDKVCFKSKCFERFGKPICGMTGKFNLCWGEFGGYKNAATLKYECAYALSLGISISVGDQLSPSGILDGETYRRIGGAYSYYRSLEKICLPSECAADLGVVVSYDSTVNEGLNYLLSDLHCDYVIADENSDFSRLKCIIVPSGARLEKPLTEKLTDYARRGGHLILSGDSAQYFSALGFEYRGRSEHDVDYVFCEKIMDCPFVSYRPAYVAQNANGETRAKVVAPYFNRTYGHFCSHMHSPPKEESESYAAWLKGENWSYLAHDVFGEYYDCGQEHMRDYFALALFSEYLPPVRVDGLQSCGRVRFRKNAEKRQLYVHVLYAPVVKKGKQFCIPDLPVVNGLTAEVRVESRVKKVAYYPAAADLRFEQKGNCVKFELPPLCCHGVAVIEYED